MNTLVFVWTILFLKFARTLRDIFFSSFGQFSAGAGIFSLISFITQLFIGIVIFGTHPNMTESNKWTTTLIGTFIQTIISIKVYDRFRNDFFGIEKFKENPENKPKFPKLVLSLIYVRSENKLVNVTKMILTICLTGTATGFILNRNDDAFAFTGIESQRAKILLFLCPLIILPWRMGFYWGLSKLALLWDMISSLFAGSFAANNFTLWVT
jgi:hypothetical protein